MQHKRPQSFFRSIRTELTCWFLLLALVPLILVSSISYWQARESLIESATEQLKQNSQNTIQIITNWFDYRWMDLNRLVDTELNVLFLEALNQQRIESNQPISEFVHSYVWADIAHTFQGDLVKLASRYDYIYDIFLIDGQGNIIFSVAKKKDFGTNLNNGPHAKTQFASAVRRSFATGETVFSDFERYQASDTLTSGFIAAPLINDKGDRIGVMAIEIRPTRIQSAFNVIKDNTLHYLTASDGILRTKIDDDSEVLVRNIRSQRTESAFASHDPDDGIHAVENYIGARGNQVIGISQPVKIWNVDWILVSEVDRDTALAAANWLGKFVLFALLLTVAIVAYLAFVISRRITRPISLLAEATELMEKGQLDKPIDLKAENEMGRLVSGFNKMMNARRIHEEELLLEKSNAEQASLAKSEFLACMSHEIRTPMNGVLGMLSLTLNAGVTDEQRRKLLIAQSSAESLLSLINDILDYSKIEAGKLALEMLDFNLSDLLGEIATASALKANEKGVELILNIGQIAPGMMVKGDPSRLRQILVNLLGNANKFTRQGEIILSAKLQESGDGLRLTCTVSDTGIGIPKDKIAHLFDSFSQVDASTTREFGGTGLGLAISQRLIELTGGEITVHSEPSVGSTFEFDMILEHSTMQAESRREFSSLNANILILDDNNTNREILRAQVESWGGKVSEANCVDDALAACRSTMYFDVVLVDMQMPEKSGIDFSEALLQEPALAHIELLLLSSVDELVKPSQLKALGFSARLTKPVLPVDLYECISFVLQKDKTFNQTNSLITPEYLRTIKIKQEDNLEQGPVWDPNVRILLVEDNLINQEVVKGLLSQFNLRCDFACDGLEALQVLQEAPTALPYTLVFMDCQMPEMDGYQATKQIRLGKAGERNKHIPIVAMTANAMQGDRDKCLEAGMNDYLSKPLNPQTVQKALFHWIERTPITKVTANIQPTPPMEETIIQNLDGLKIPHGLKTFDLKNSPPDIAKNATLYLKLLNMYLDNDDQYAEKLLVQANAANIQAVKDTVHSIKGVSGNLGIIKVYEFAKTFESGMLQTGDIPNGATEELILLVQQSFQDIELILKVNEVS